MKLYVKSQKKDAADAEAICEAVTRPNMRFVPVKGEEQQAVLLLHRTRDLLIRQRSSLISAIQAHFAEFGIAAGQGIRNIDRLLALLQTGANAERRLPPLAADMLGLLASQLRAVGKRVDKLEAKLLAWHRADETSSRLQAVPGIGPITANALVAIVGDPRQLGSGRQFTAWLRMQSNRVAASAPARPFCKLRTRS